MKKLTLLLAALLCFAGYSQAQFATFEGHTYVPLPVNTLSTHKAIAELLGGHLVYVNSTAEKEFLQSTFVLSYAGYWFTGEEALSGVWTDEGVENHWLNFTGVNNFWSLTNPRTPYADGAIVCMIKENAFYRSRNYVARFIQFQPGYGETHLFKAIVEIE